MENKLWKIFKSTLYLSAFTFGGGYVILTLMKDTFVDKLKWIDKDQMLDMTAIAQSAPGAVAINASIVVGYEIAGLPGMAVAILGTAIPALIFKVSFDMGRDILKEKSKIVPVIMVTAFILGYFIKVNIVYIIGGLILLGLVNSLAKRRSHVN